MRLICVVIILGLFGLVACGPEQNVEQSCEFVQNSFGERVSWKGELPIVFYLHESFPQQYVPAVEAAMSRWEQTYGMEMFKLAGYTNAPLQPKQDQWNIMYWMNTWEPNRKYEQARTSIYWLGDKIREADIRFNARDFRYFWGMRPDPSAVDIESLAVHELGHVLGLSHVEDESKGSVMNPVLKYGTFRRQISDSDVASLECEY